MLTARFIASFLAIALLWAGFATQEQATVIASSFTEEGVERRVIEKSVETRSQAALHSMSDYPLDDPALQAHAEPVADVPGLVPPTCAAQSRALGTSHPCPYTLVALPPPYLGGLHRPPRANDRLA